MVTIKDVAKKAGINISTVSRVINNKGYISEKTRAIVYKVIEELGYQPNEVARSLLKRKSNLLGVILPNVAYPFYAQLTSSIEYYAYKSGYKVMICNSYGDAMKENDYINMLKRSQVDGIIMGGHTMETFKYENLERPIVTIDRDISKDIPNISSDHYNGGVLATNLLIEKGCRKLAHIRGILIKHFPVANRSQAFEDVASEKKISYIISEIDFNFNDMDIEEYEKSIFELFNDHPDIDGVFANNDMIAAAIINVASKLGRVIPTDLKVIGYDDVLISSLLKPKLTSVRQPIKRIAELVVQTIIDQLEGTPVKSETILPVELIERETT